MPAPAVQINLIAVLVSAVLGMVIGAAWYSSLLFGRVWMAISGITEKKIAESKKKGMAKSYAVAFVAMLVMSYVLAHFVAYLQAGTPLEGALAGLWIWLGFVTTVLINGVLWEGKPVKLYVLNIAHYLVVLIVMGAILAVWA